MQQSPNPSPAQLESLPPAAGPGTLTLSSKVPADEGSIHILQQDDALLRRHAQQVVEPVIGEAAVTEAQQADTILQVPSQGCTGKDRNHSSESQQESPEQKNNQMSLNGSRGEDKGTLPWPGYGAQPTGATQHCAKQGHEGLVTLTHPCAGNANFDTSHCTVGHSMLWHSKPTHPHPPHKGCHAPQQAILT